MKISLVCPCFNEEAAVNIFLDHIVPLLSRYQYDYEIICINDGSRDKTLDILIDAQSRGHKLKIIDLSRNFGKEAALTAGLAYATGDVVIPIDIDLQDPPELIPKLLNKWEEGYEVVLAKRIDRSADSFIKKITAGWFYKILDRLSDVPIPSDVGDFRLMDIKVAKVIAEMPEGRRFMKGLFAWAGFKTAVVEFTRQERSAGKTKFNGWRLWNFALEGITSFSTTPLRIWTYLGMAFSLASFAYALYIITRTLITGIDLPGYASLLTVILFLGGVQLIGLGIIGEYLGRTYIETKRRPVFLIRKIYE